MEWAAQPVFRFFYGIFFVMLAARLLRTEKLFHSRDHSDIEQPLLPHTDDVLTAEAAQLYLVKYGWKEPVNWEEQSFHDVPVPKDTDKAPNDVSQLIFEGELSKRHETDLPKSSMTSSSFIEPLKRFQKANGLQTTGILDEPTKTAMNTPRCGVPDHKVEFNGTVANETLNNNDMIRSMTIADNSSSSNPQNNTLEATHARKKRFLSRLIAHTRKKRHNEDALGLGSSLSFSKTTLKWKLIGEGYSMQLSLDQQKSILNLAFRMWSEVIPVQFEEDMASSDVDIRLGFGTGQHLGCSQAFDGVGQQFAHAWYLGDIHFDDDEHFVGPSNVQGISLLKVAVHEIGHALGLPHINRPGSVMQPNYVPEDGRFELHLDDRKAMQERYGSCEGSYSTIFDWVRKETTQHGEVVYRFNTYFFKTSWYWMYENKSNRTRFGDPIPIKVGWRGLPDFGIDAYIHVWTWSRDAQYFFKGTQIWRYDPHNDMTFTDDAQGNRYPKLITEVFPGSPSPVDATFFDKRRSLVYLFRGNNVTAFRADHHQKVDGFPKRITDVFPAVDPGDHPIGNLDAVYFSYTHLATFFIKDKFYWKMVDDWDRQVNASLPSNGLLPRKKINSKWFDICDVHPSMLFLTT
uniref:Matrix metalloproteinase-21-like isoform X1 n=2 Tax=Geotrypetes seraphini TaxID=260995 RepID=A0A6P8Q972_GEOSA|nr:matrix metalloproteinase-21-like isoform X1 [Geotrypetes seraphini]XP_033783723.1 matrix metalloproteinase-21-like isoform X1 [Geotrypetes seraphini]